MEQLKERVSNVASALKEGFNQMMENKNFLQCGHNYDVSEMSSSQPVLCDSECSQCDSENQSISMAPSSRSSHVLAVPALVDVDGKSRKSHLLHDSSLNISQQLFEQNMSVTSDKKVVLVQLNSQSGKKRRKLTQPDSSANKEN